jgi:hypothetical protein
MDTDEGYSLISEESRIRFGPSTPSNTRVNNRKAVLGTQDKP